MASTAQILVNNGIDNINKLLNVTIEQLEKMAGIGTIKAKAIYDGIQEKRFDIMALSDHVIILKKEGNLIGKSFAFTGTMKTPRKVLESQVIDAGGEIKKSVTKGLTYLVISDPNSTSTKAQKARKLGTELINEVQFMEMT